MQRRVKLKISDILSSLSGYSKSIKTIIACIAAICTVIASYFVYMDSRYVKAEEFVKQVNIEKSTRVSIAEVSSRLENKINQDRYNSLSDSILQLELKYGEKCKNAPNAVKVIYEKLKRELKLLELKLNKEIRNEN